MKYIQYFKENSNSFNKDIVFDNKDWLIIKPSNYESMCYWGQDTEWRVSDGAHEYYYKKDGCYVIIEKPDKKESNNQLNLFNDDLVRNEIEINKKWFFNIYNSEFLDSEENQIYIKEFLENDSDLYNFFGEQIQCSEIVEIGGEWWIVVDDYVYFDDYFKLDHRTRNTLIKEILNGEGREIFSFSRDDFEINNENIVLNEDNLTILKTLLFLEKKFNDYDYDILKIKNYDDIVEIIKDYEFEELETIFQECIRDAYEVAQSSEAWNDVVNNIYSFFNLDDGSAKWDYYKGSKNQMLWIKFKNKESAIYAKYRIYNFESEWSDDMINYSPPYYGWYGSQKEIIENFIESFDDRISNYESSNLDFKLIYKYYEVWKKLKLEGIKDVEIIDEIELRVEAEQYNL